MGERSQGSLKGHIALAMQKLPGTCLPSRKCRLPLEILCLPRNLYTRLPEPAASKGFLSPQRNASENTCNTRATHVQHTCNTTCNRSIFAANSYDFSLDGAQISPFPFEVALGRRKWPESHFDWKFTGKVVVLLVVLHVCCTSVARLLHVCCMEISNQSCAPHENLSGYLIETQKTENHRTVRDMPAQSGSRVSFSSLLRSFSPNGSAGHDASLGRH